MSDIISMVVPTVVAAVSAPLGAWLNSRLLKGKYQIELENLRAEMQNKFSGVRANELENVRKANDILVDSIVDPLKKEIQTLRKDVEKFRKAIEKIPSCSHADTCPVSAQLQRSERSEHRKEQEQSEHQSGQ